MARPMITQLRQIGDVLTMYQWEVELSESKFGFDTDGVNVRCVSTDLPRMTGSSIDVSIRGHKVRWPGIYDSTHTITLTMMETDNLYISNGIKAWREACWEFKTGKQETKLNSEISTITLKQLNRQNEVKWLYILTGCFLEDYDPTGGQWGGDTSDILRPTLTISYDFFEDKAA